jgi:glycosyltransferase involved in cell wall biosynthesis
MKILIDGRALSHEHITGIERYTLSVIGAFKKTGLEFDLLKPENPNRYTQHLWEHTALPYKAKQYDVLFCPANISPLWKPKGCKYVTVIHDVSYKLFKDAYKTMYRAYHSFMLNRVMKIADRVITGSDIVKDSLVSLYPRYRNKIVRIYDGVDSRFVRSEDGKKEDYILYVGSLNPRKNYEGVIKAFLKIKDNIPHKLLIVGANPGIYKTELSIQSERVIFKGSVNDEELISLYQKASLFLFPSFYEGFGLPVLEAMACGCPVVTSNTSSLPEVAGDAAILVDPKDQERIADAALKVLTDQGLREKLIAAGFERAKMFTWDKTAAGLKGIFKELSEKGRK